jgi:hypothetical protein
MSGWLGSKITIRNAGADQRYTLKIGIIAGLNKILA